MVAFDQAKRRRDERIEALLARGYLPKELPPPFTSAAFARNVANFIPHWASYEAGLTAQQRRLYPPISRYARFDMARKGHSRRMLGVPNPVNQYYLTSAIADHQDEFEAICARSPISLTSAQVSLTGNRAVTLPKLSLLSEKRIQSYATARAILQTDVLSFYHAIYTHSIPWALHGKRIAKRNRSTTDPAVYGNRIDALLRGCQDGQTIGIPVGPDSSRIISELILCAIEQQIGADHFARLTAGYRYMDDFFLCFASHVDAEAFLAALREAVLSFDLQLNASKTHIMDALGFNEESWPGDIAQLRLARSTNDQRRDLIRFFSEVIRLSKSWPDESIASFAVRKTSRSLIHRANWDLYEPFLLRIARENSNCLDSVIKILCTYAAAGYPISERIKDFAEGMIEEHAPYNHHYEVVWTLWLCRSLSIRLGERATQLVAKVENSFCACLVLMLRSRALLTGRGAISDWIGTVNEEDLLGEHWMLVYEAGIRKSWKLPGAEAAVSVDPHFRVLRDQRISFFDTAATNVALELPTINQLLEASLGERRSAVLPGTIYVESRTPRRQRRYEKLGEDYGSDDFGWSGFPREDGSLDDDNDFDF
ncbi:RNA-directed DNA polymerase [Mesorhizobium sp.]|uniref:RNA-directed DNA polymerase n=1 Tax=Mesorhizobium sp. TaxID=1871066 RepID=UPI000FE92F8F|nr:RNA-directed DNA polymerase [Mesorhizobium sp.]RWP08949.1 MAG: RNA-directed DNA polymerase [Mesorhizobium sp.]